MGRHEARVAILYGGLSSQPTARDVRLARAVLATLKGARMTAWVTTVRRPISRLLRGLSRRRPDVVVPLVPFEGGSPGTPGLVASMLEWLELPYVGSRPPALGVAEDDFLRSAVLEAAGLGRGDLGDAIDVGVVSVGDDRRVVGEIDPGAASVALAAFESLGLRDQATIRVQPDASHGWGVAGVSPVLDGHPTDLWAELVQHARARATNPPE